MADDELRDKIAEGFYDFRVERDRAILERTEPKGGEKAHVIPAGLVAQWRWLKRAGWAGLEAEERQRFTARAERLLVKLKPLFPQPEPTPAPTRTGAFPQFGAVCNNARAGWMEMVGAKIATRVPSEEIYDEKQTYAFKHYALLDDDPYLPMLSVETLRRMVNHPQYAGCILLREPDLRGMSTDAAVAFVLEYLERLKEANPERKGETIIRMGSQIHAPHKANAWYPPVHERIKHRYGEVSGVALNFYISAESKNFDVALDGTRERAFALKLKEWVDKNVGLPILLGEYGLSNDAPDVPLLHFYPFVGAEQWRGIAKTIFWYILEERGDGYRALVKDGVLTDLGAGYRALQASLSQ